MKIQTPDAVNRWRLYRAIACFVALVTIADPNGGMIDQPISFLLKNEFHFDASATARFRLIASVPLFLSLVFGLLRDTWGAAGVSDRALVVVFSLLGAAVYFVSAFAPTTPGTLLGATLLGTCVYQMVVGAQSGLVASIARRTRLTGEMSTVWNVVISLAASIAFYAGGQLSQYLAGLGVENAARALFSVYAGISAAIALYAALDPGSIFCKAHGSGEAATGFMSNLTMLARHRATYPPLLIWFIWNFAPGSATPLQYYLQDTLGATNAEWGEWNAIFNATFVPMLLAYGLLSARASVCKLVHRATLLALPQYLPLLFVRTLDEAMIAAALIGLLGGLATAAYLDLLFRACPQGLEGATMMAAASLYFVATRAGDVIGAYLYETPGGLLACVVFSTTLYATILLVLPHALPRKTECELLPTPSK